jgi:hypothetical protein
MAIEAFAAHSDEEIAGLHLPGIALDPGEDRLRWDLAA